MSGSWRRDRLWDQGLWDSLMGPDASSVIDADEVERDLRARDVESWESLAAYAAENIYPRVYAKFEIVGSGRLRISQYLRHTPAQSPRDLAEPVHVEEVDVPIGGAVWSIRNDGPAPYMTLTSGTE